MNSRAEVGAYCLINPAQVAPSQYDPEIHPCLVKFDPENPVLLNCGLWSPVYLDPNREVLSFPYTARGLTVIMSNELKASGFDYQGLAGVANSGTFFAVHLQAEMGLPMINIKKEEKTHGGGGFIEGRIDPSINYVAIENVFTSGLSATQAILRARRTGATIPYALSLFTYGWDESFARFEENGIQARSAITFEPLFEKAKALGVVRGEKEEKIAEWATNPSKWSDRYVAASKS